MDLVVRSPRMPQPGETLVGRTFAQVPGGKGGNQAVAAARLGAAVSMIGRIGADANGAQLKQGLEVEGIDCSGVSSDAALPTGVALITVDDASQNSIVIVAGSNGALTPEGIAAREPAIAAADVVVCQLETPRETVFAAMQTARRDGRTVVLNPAPVTAPLPRDWLELADFVIPNEIEAAALSGVTVDSPEAAYRAAAALREQGARTVIVTLGGQGVFVLGDHNAQTHGTHYPARRVDAVDTTAAGDTFVGGFAATLASGRSIDEAVRFGLAAAALSVTRAGAQPSIPRLAEVAL
ncbi:ribokinase [Pararobbsia silviterrae]|uniref:Deoxyribokinase n=2 Tax=Pararobbsia silviterrae TaxID=1792498 RepID=A0A494X8W7_9BURK|nr:ribokinase [Pararobbsia silviterrae]